MNSYQNITTELNDGILLLTIDRPKALNALNIETIKELGQVIQFVNDNQEIKGVVITGSGDKAFVAGADIKEIAELDMASAKKFAQQGQQVFAKIENSKKPIIAAVNGFALGGGCELAMACHIRIASSNAKFGLPEVSLGVIPGYGGTQRMTQLVGKGKAFELIATGDMIDANEAKAIGLVNHIAENKEEILSLSYKILDKIIKKAPLAVGLAFDAINAVFSEKNGYQTETDNFATCCNTEDFKEGTQAFIEKRKASFLGK